MANNQKWFLMKLTLIYIVLIFVPAYGSNNCSVNKYNESSQQKSFIEVVMVVDKELYLSLQADILEAFIYCRYIVNIVNSLYKPLNIAVALVDVVVWTNENVIEISNNLTATLFNFLEYRRTFLTINHPNDYAILLTANYVDDVLGKTVPYSMCSYKYAGAVVYGSSETLVVAVVTAHELAHSIGVQHDSPECECNANFCIMSDGLTAETPNSWSSCSIQQINLAFSQGMNHCLRKQPETRFGHDILNLCGNGFVDAGEQCDCGLIDSCNNTCCNPITCMLHSNASCASGECCDLSTCSIFKAGRICRPTEGECEIEEHCTGNSEYCPQNVLKKMDILAAMVIVMKVLVHHIPPNANYYGVRLDIRSMDVMLKIWKALTRAIVDTTQ